MHLSANMSPSGSGGDDLLVAAWSAIRAGLRADVGARTFDHWLKPLELVGFRDDDQAIRLALPSEFMANWVSSHYTDRLTHAWRAMLPQVRTVRIEAFGAPVARYARQPEAAESEAIDTPEVPSQFDRRLTFDSFVVGPMNEVARNAAMQICSDDGVSFNPLYIHSQTGQGKTHLLHAIGHAYLANKPGARVQYMSAERFMFDFVTAMRARDTLTFKARLRSADLLMIDDVQFIAGKESTQEEFLHTVDELMSGGKRLVISADRAPHGLDGVEGRILSRLTQGLVADIAPADFALRKAILTRKIAVQGRTDIPEVVIELLAARILSNVRELEGALNRLLAYAQLGNKKVDEAFAEDVLAEMFRASRRRITIDEIQRRVSEHYKIRQAEMVSARRAREVARPRQVAMYLAKQLTPRSLPEIGRKFGGRDHTTVIHAVRQIERLRGCDTDIDNDVRSLIRQLES